MHYSPSKILIFFLSLIICPNIYAAGQYYEYGNGGVACREMTYTEIDYLMKSIKEKTIKLEKEYTKYKSYVGTHYAEEEGYSVIFSDKKECQKSGQKSFEANKKIDSKKDSVDKIKKSKAIEGAKKFFFIQYILNHSSNAIKTPTVCESTTKDIYFDVEGENSSYEDSYYGKKLPLIGASYVKSIKRKVGDHEEYYYDEIAFYYENQTSCEKAYNEALQAFKK